jgi:hypothetical protein
MISKPSRILSVPSPIIIIFVDYPQDIRGPLVSPSASNQRQKQFNPIVSPHGRFHAGLLKPSKPTSHKLSGPRCYGLYQSGRSWWGASFFIWLAFCSSEGEFLTFYGVQRDPYTD